MALDGGDDLVHGTLAVNVLPHYETGGIQGQRGSRVQVDQDCFAGVNLA